MEEHSQRQRSKTRIDLAAVILFILLLAVATVAILTLLGPAIGNVFSNVTYVF